MNSLHNISQRIIVGGLHLLLVITPLLFFTKTSELFEFNKMSFVYLVASLMVGVWLTRMVISGRLLMRRTSFDWWLGLWAIALLLASLFSIHPYTSWWGYYSRFNGGLMSWLAYGAIFYVGVNTLSRKNLPALFISALVGLMAGALYALPEHFGHSPSCLLITGQFDAACWVQDVSHRVFGTFGQPNWLAAHLVSLLPLALLLMPVSTQLAKLTGLPRKLVELSLPAISLASFLALLFTKSRSGFLGFGVSIVIILIGLILPYLWPKLSKLTSTIKTPQQNPDLFGPSSSYRWRNLIITLLILAGITAWIGSPFSQPLTRVIGLGQSASAPAQATDPEPSANRLESGGTDSGEIRKIVWVGALQIWLRYPLFGSGPETFAYSYYLDRPLEHNLVSEWNFLYNKAHNEFLNLLATTGILGLISYLCLVGWTATLAWRGWWRGIHQPLPESALATLMPPVSLAILAGLAGQMVSNALGFATVSIMVVWIMMMIWLEVWFFDRTQPISIPVKLSIRQKLGLLGAAVLTGWLLFNFGQRFYADILFARGKNLAASQQHQAGITYLTRAARLQPREALFYDELAGAYSRLALETHLRAKEMTLALDEEAADAEVLAGIESISDLTGEFASRAEEFSQFTLSLNPVHLNFYKSQARVYNRLAQIDPEFHQQTAVTLEAARRLAPTDPHISYNLALVYGTQGRYQDALELMAITLKMKPDYEAAWYSLGNIYEIMEEFEMATETYQHLLEKVNANHPEAREALENLSVNDELAPAQD